MDFKEWKEDMANDNRLVLLDGIILHPLEWFQIEEIDDLPQEIAIVLQYLGMYQVHSEVFQVK